MSSKPEATNEARIFISYRFADKPVAEVIRRNLTRWGFDNIYFARGGRSTQSPRIGENLSDQLRKALAEAELVILVYTLVDEDWAWCMWECGLASALGEIDSTRVVVFQCSISDTPKVFSDDVLVRVEDPTSIRDFTKQLHKDAGFFKDRSAYRPGYSDQDLEDLSSTFYQELASELPSVLPAGELEERYRWDRFTLKLENPADFLDIEPNADTSKRIQSELVVTNPFGNALRHFGLADPRDDLKLSDLVERWTK
jgi:TIR domain